MTFQVERPGLGEQPYGNDDVYEVLEGGALAIHRGDPKFEDESYPPDKWDFVSTDGDHPPGFTSGGAAEPSVVVQRIPSRDGYPSRSPRVGVAAIAKP